MTTSAGLLSIAFGAGVGAFLTAIVYLSHHGWLTLPRFSSRAMQAGVVAAIFVFYISNLWNAVLAFIVMLFAVDLIYENQLRYFLNTATLTRLMNAKAGQVLAIGGLSGAVAGAISSQFLMIPLRHCTFESGVTPLTFRLGLAVTAASTLVLLIPLWTLLIRGRRIFQSDLGQSGHFRGTITPYLLLMPTLIILVVFLYYPGSQIVQGSLEREAIRIGQPGQFICLDNYTRLIDDERYQHSFTVTFQITAAIVLIGMAMSLFIANIAYQKIRGASLYRTLLIWPYAISPVVIGAVFLAMFNPVVGVVNWILFEVFQQRPQWFTEPTLAVWMIIGAAIWNTLGFNILFYIAGLQSVPDDLLEAASIDGANTIQRFFFVKFPLLMPYTFFLLVTNVTYSFYGIFGLIDRLTEGGPRGQTGVLIYKLYQDAFLNTGKGGLANAQSLILFLLVAAITVIQFRFVERRVTYGG